MSSKEREHSMATRSMDKEKTETKTEEDKIIGMADNEGEMSQQLQEPSTLHSMYIKLGTEMNLTGSELQNFVLQSIKMEKEEERKLKEMEKEEERRLREEERKLKEEERKMIELKLKHEQEMRKIELKLTKESDKESHHHQKLLYPKMPKFNEDKDDIDSFMCRFENTAKNNKWNKDEWAHCLAAHLDGPALTIYHNLFAGGKLTYDILKEELLKRYKCTKDSFRMKLRNSKPDQQEAFSAYGERISHYLRQWISLSKVKETYNDLFEFILIEQTLASCSKDLQVYLQEKNPADFTELLKEADIYKTAHPNKDLARRENPSPLQIRASVANSNENLQNDRKQTSQYQENQRQDNYENFRSQNQFRGNGRMHQNRPGRGGRNSYQGHGRGFYQQQRQGYNDMICRNCNKAGHLAKDCYSKYRAQACSSPTTIDRYQIQSSNASAFPIENGTINSKPAKVLRDTGANISGVRKSYVQKDQILDKTVTVKMFTGRKEILQMAEIDVDCPFYTGKIECCILDDPEQDLVLGNVEGVKPSVDFIMGWEESDKDRQALVVTRNQKKKEMLDKEPIEIPEMKEMNIDKNQLKKLQREDESLKQLFDEAKTKQFDDKSNYLIRNEILVREHKRKDGSKVSQLVVPRKLRSQVLSAAHDGILAGHGGVKRTISRIYSNFFWPGVNKDTKDYCRSCTVCQKASPRPQRAPLEFMPIITEPFKRVAVDITGPLPVSESNNRFILSIVCVSTRYCEAVPLKNIDSITIADELIKVFARMGFPSEILSDCASNFTSSMIKEMYKMLNITPIQTSVYHKESNGVVERFHGTIKPMLRKLAEKQPKKWDRLLPILLYACRDVPNETTGFSPFELLFARKPCGPLDLMAEAWRGEKEKEQERTTYQHVLDMKNFFFEMDNLVRENVQKATKSNKFYKDRGSKQRSFQVGQKVLIMLPTNNNKLQMMWKGPYEIIEKRNNDYVIEFAGRKKVFHVNMLKLFVERSEEPTKKCEEKKSQTTKKNDSKIDMSEIIGHEYENEINHKIVKSAIIPESEEVDEPQITVVDTSKHKETLDEIGFDEELTQKQRKEIRKIFEQNKEILTSNPGNWKSVDELEINLKDNVPIVKKQYPLPFAAKKNLEEEINSLMNLGVIEPSKSPYASPCVMIKKPNGSMRLCIDYRELNKKLIFDAEPMPDTEAIFASLADAHYFTKIDLSKGYYQIPVADKDRPITAFQTPMGLFQFCRMPFGLASAPAVFARCMRTLKLEDFSSINFFDDILIYSQSWEEHLNHVEGVLKLLKEKDLTIKPSKVMAGFQEIEFLGHVVGKGAMKPEQKKIKQILEISVPNSRKQIQSVLGLLGYYRRYVPMFSELTKPMTDLLKGGKGKALKWNDKCSEALKKIQQILSSEPILRLPDVSKNFLVRTDASSTGIGAVLLQEKQGILYPISFVSRKLMDREQRYSTIERECLAIVWSIKKLDRYLWGKSFTLETDHKPLTYLSSSTFRNSRIMRWSLCLQEFKFEVRPISGPKNIWADLLSRSITNQSIP